MGPDFGEIYFKVQNQLWHLWADHKLYFILAVVLIFLFIWEEIRAFR